MTSEPKDPPPARELPDAMRGKLIIWSGETLTEDCADATTADLKACLASLPEAERASLFAPYLFDGTRRDESSEAVEEAAVDADCERILSMSDEELDAEIRAQGRDPERMNRWARSTGRMVAMLARAYSEKRTEAERAEQAEAKLALYRRGYEARGKILAAYRTGCHPGEKALDEASAVADALAADSARTVTP